MLVQKLLNKKDTGCMLLVKTTALLLSNFRSFMAIRPSETHLHHNLVHFRQAKCTKKAESITGIHPHMLLTKN